MAFLLNIPYTKLPIHLAVQLDLQDQQVLQYFPHNHMRDSSDMFLVQEDVLMHALFVNQNQCGLEKLDIEHQKILLPN